MKRSKYTEEQIIGILYELVHERIGHARNISENYRIDYNYERPHSTPGNLTPSEFVRLEVDKVVGIL